MKLSIVIPIYNEQEVLPHLYERLDKAMRRDFALWDVEIVLVDDGSTDGSAAYMESVQSQDERIVVVQFSRNFGHHMAITAGMDIASGDFMS